MRRLLGSIALLFAASCGVDFPGATGALRSDVADPGPLDELRVVTLNLLGTRERLDERLAASIEQLRAEDPHVVALQEVKPWVLERLAADGWLTSTFAAPALEVYGAAPRGNLLLTRLPAEHTESIRLDGPQAREHLVTRLRVNGCALDVAVVHLESWAHDGARRAAQLDRLEALLAGSERAVALGDFNFADGREPETAHLPDGLLDPWPLLRPGEPGLTWDPARNPSAERERWPGDEAGRFDRILVRGLEPCSVAMLGTARARAAVRWTRLPSDHFGVRATLALPARCGATPDP